jgi:hypothetical protein
MATTKVDPKLNDGNLAKKTYQGLTSQQLIDAYRIMFTSRRVSTTARSCSSASRRSFSRSPARATKLSELPRHSR